MRITPAKTLLEKLEDKVLIDDGCWQWTAGTSSGGYGKLRVDGKHLRAHRVLYELLVGPIPEGMTLDHLCRNILCVNPSHMEVVTARVNILRGEGIAARKARQTHCKNGHSLMADGDVYVYKSGRRACRVCSRQREREERRHMHLVAKGGDDCGR